MARDKKELDDIEEDLPSESEDSAPDSEPSEEADIADEDKDDEAYGELKADPNNTLEGAAQAAIEETAVEKAPESEVSPAPNKDQDLMQTLSALSGQKQGPSQLDKYKDFMAQYNALQQQRNKSDLVAGLAAAGGKIGQSMAGRYSGQFNPDMTGVKVLQQMAERPVQDFEQGQVVQGRGMQLQQEIAANDPNSPQSQMVRKYLSQRLNMNLPETVSASDAMLLMKTMGRPQVTKFSAPQPVVNQQTGEKTMAIFNTSTGSYTNLNGVAMGPEWTRDYRSQSFVDPATQERLGFSGGTGKVTGSLTGPGVNRPGAPTAAPGEPVELTRPMLTAQQAKQLDQQRHQYINEVKDDRNSINSADRVINVLQTGDQLGGDILGELRDQMSRAFGQKGHITDSQMGRVLGREDWKSKFQNAVSIASEGKLDDENREFLKNVMTAIRDQNQLFVTNKAKVYSTNMANDFKSAPNLKGANVTPESINKLLGVQAAAASSAQKALVKKGYNPTTNKTQLIYSDGSKEIVDGKQ